MSEKNDPTWHWPEEWRREFREMNADLQAQGDDLVTYAEFLRCRYEDRAEQLDRDEVTRSQRHHEVFLKMLEVCFKSATPWNEGDCRQTVEAANFVAGLAYPKPDVKP